MRDGWGQILITGALSCVFAIIAGLVIHFYTEQSPSLHYSVAKTDPFYGASAATSIYKIDIVTSGKHEIDNFVASIVFPGAKIDDKRLNAPQGLVATETSQNNSYTITAPSLNPGDQLSASFLVTASFPSEPEISVRARGITGTPSNSGKGWFHRSALLWTAAFLGLLVSFSGFLSSKVTQSTLGHPNSGQRDVLAYGFFMEGLVQEGTTFLSMRKCSYWSQSDRIATEYILGSSPEETKKAARALEHSLDYKPRISPVSIDIMNYNIARMWLSVGDEVRAQNHLKKALFGNHTFVLKRLKLTAEMKALALKNIESYPSFVQKNVRDLR